jgi:type IV pilus assembly protein PilV
MRRIISTPAAVRGRRNQGFALIEALIAIVIFSLGALGLLGLQVSMMKATSGAKFRADAAYLANDLVGTMWADTANLVAYRDSCSSHLPCKNWIAKVGRTLPGNVPPELEIVPSTGYVRITINWVVPNEAPHSFNTSTSINR